jgi:hypothetical protein
MRPIFIKRDPTRLFAAGTCRPTRFLAAPPDEWIMGGAERRDCPLSDAMSDWFTGVGDGRNPG